MPDYDLLPSVVKDLPKAPKFDPLHNHLVNYLMLKQIANKIQCIPSRLYVVRNESNETVLSLVGVSGSDQSPSWLVRCIMPSTDVERNLKNVTEVLQWMRDHRSGQRIFVQKLRFSGTIYFFESSKETVTSLTGIVRKLSALQFVRILNLLYEIQKVQPVTLQQLDVWGLTDCSLLERVMLRTLNFSTKMTSLRMALCTLPASVWDRLVKQLHGCNTLVVVDLDSTKHIPVQFCKTLSTTTSLRRVNLEHCIMSSDVSHILLSSLRHCKHLVEVNLSGNTLTDCIRELLGPAVVFPKIETLNLSHTRLSVEDVINLEQIITSTNMPKIKELDLSNNTLIDSLKEFLLPSLEVLNLKDTSLSRA